MTERRRVLVTNDDGFAAPGLSALAEAAASDDLDVVVAAPAAEASGSSAAMSAYTSDGRVIIERGTLPGLHDVQGYAVAASPSYIVVLAMLETFGPRPDLVLSGINRGANAGRAILHSGTVGAALTAASYGCPSMAVSLDVLSPHLAPGDEADVVRGAEAIELLDAATEEARNWDTAADVARSLLPALREASDGTVLNLNVPDLPTHQIPGVRQAKLARFGQVQMAIAESGEDFVRTAVEQNRVRAEPETDLAWLSEGYATVTAIGCVIEDVAFELPRTLELSDIV